MGSWRLLDRIVVFKVLFVRRTEFLVEVAGWDQFEMVGVEKSATSGVGSNCPEPVWWRCHF